MSKNRWRALLVVAVLATAASSAGNARAFVLLFSSFTDRTPNLFLSLGNVIDTDDAILQVVEDMSDAWYQQTSAKFRFNVPQFTTSSVVKHDSKNIVIIRNDRDGTLIAETISHFRQSDMKLLSFDIIVHAKNKIVTNVQDRVLAALGSPCTDRFILDDALVHEFGHAAGLGESPLSAATMFGKMSACETKKMSLLADDVAGIEAFYGTGEP